MSKLIWVRGIGPCPVPHPLVANANPMRFLGRAPDGSGRWEQCPRHLIEKNLRPGRNEFEVSDTDPALAPPPRPTTKKGDQ